MQITKLKLYFSETCPTERKQSTSIFEPYWVSVDTHSKIRFKSLSFASFHPKCVCFQAFSVHHICPVTCGVSHRSHLHLENPFAHLWHPHQRRSRCVFARVVEDCVTRSCFMLRDFISNSLSLCVKVLSDHGAVVHWSRLRALVVLILATLLMAACADLCTENISPIISNSSVSQVHTHIMCKHVPI